MAATDRLEVRLAADAKQRIELAARLRDVSVGEFVRTAAEEEAEAVLRDQTVTILPADDFDRLLAALDAPVTPAPALVAAARRAGKILGHA